MQLCVSRQDCILDVCVLKKFTYGVNKSPVIEHVLETRVLTVLYKLVWRERTVREPLGQWHNDDRGDEHVESSSIFLTGKQCT